MDNLSGDSGDVVDVKTGPLGIHLGGRNALVIFIVLAIMADSALTYWEHMSRSSEHDAIMSTMRRLSCKIDLQIYIYQRPSGNLIDWQHMPSGLWGCLPKFIMDKPGGGQ